MSENKLTGKVIFIGETQVVSDKFQKRELVVEYAENPTYPEYIKFEALQDKVALFDDLSVGAEVEVLYNLRGKAYTSKDGKTGYFNSLVAWRINVLQSTPIENAVVNDSSDLPF